MKTITLPAGTEAVRYDELAHLIALAMWPLKNDGSPGDGLNYGFASVTLERELAQAVEAKDIPLKDPLTLGPYIDHPGGTRLEDALVRVDDLRKYVADRGVVVVVNEIDTPVQALEQVPIVEPYSVEKMPPVPPVEPASDGYALPTFIHSTKTRRDALTPVIELAQSKCRNATDTAEVWAALLVLAEKKTAPLIGATEEGLQYLKNGTAAIFNRDALRKRLGR